GIQLRGRRPSDLFVDLDVRNWTLAYLGAYYDADLQGALDDARGRSLELQPATMVPAEFDQRLAKLIATMPGAAEARPYLETTVAMAIAGLQEHLEVVRAQEEGDLARALQASAQDASKDAALRLRYATSFYRALRANFHELGSVKRVLAQAANTAGTTGAGTTIKEDVEAGPPQGPGACPQGQAAA